MKIINSLRLALFAVTAISASMSATAQNGEWVSLEHTDGEGLFIEKCGMCHRESGMGTGILARRMDPDLALLENRKDLDVAYIGAVVRNGLRTMFPLSRGEVGDEQLEKISSYLATED